jgi:DNA-binding transcriptional regulator YiaG
VIVDGFPEPVTGRAARIAAAREHVRRESDRHQQAEEKLNAARQQVTAAERRQRGARAAAEAGRLDGQIGGLRKKDQAARDERAKFAPALSAAQAERDEVLRLAGVRQQQVESLHRQKAILDNTNKTRREKRKNLEKEQSQLGLPELAAHWDGTPDSASEHLLALPDNQQSWTADDWWEDARGLINTAVSECFPPTASSSMPTEITSLPVSTVQLWTGRETRALRRALRMSVRVFAEHLGVSPRTVSKWERLGEATRPYPDTQAILDTALQRATADQQAPVPGPAGRHAIHVAAGEGKPRRPGTSRHGRTTSTEQPSRCPGRISPLRPCSRYGGWPGFRPDSWMPGACTFTPGP